MNLRSRLDLGAPVTLSLATAGGRLSYYSWSWLVRIRLRRGTLRGRGERQRLPAFACAQWCSLSCLVTRRIRLYPNSPHGRHNQCRNRTVRSRRMARKAGTAKFNDYLRSGIEHPIAQSALKHTDDAPYSGFGTVFPAQPDRQSVLIEHWGALIGHLRRGSSWRAHEDVTLRQ